MTTTRNIGESTTEWVPRHASDVQGATPSGNTLTTTYTSSQGVESVETIRLPNETDAQFLKRHENDYLQTMASNPPIP
ncbi:MAG: hypothetical protein ABI054_06865 [Planctomycetota bacterium]